MSDRELLELAAKAYWSGEIDDVVSVEWDDDGQSIIYTHASNQDHNGNDIELLWNPLIDDGDALRLAVKLNMCVVVDGENNHVRVYAQSFARPEEGYGDCGFDQGKCAATRRAIVRAAAEIGKVMT